MYPVTAPSGLSPTLSDIGIASDEASIEEMLFRLETDAFAFKLALRVQEVGTRSQPLARIDATDLALMIVSGRHMARVLDTITSGPVPGYTPAG